MSNGIVRVAVPTAVTNLNYYVIRFVTGSNGSSIELSDPKIADGLRFYVVNHSTASVTIKGYTVKTASGSTITSIAAGREYGLMCDGVEWFVFTN